MSEEETKPKKRRARSKKKVEEESKITGLIDTEALIQSFGELEKETTVPFQTLMDILTASMEQAYLEWSYPGLFRDKSGTDPDVELVKKLVKAKVVFTEGYKSFNLYDIKSVVNEDDIVDDSYQVSLEDAQAVNADAKIGDTVALPFDVTLLNKAYVRRVKQLLSAKIKEASKQAILAIYQKSIGHLIEGTVSEVDENRHGYVLNFGKASGVLRGKDLIPGDTFSKQEKVKVYLRDVSDRTSPAGLLITRTDANFIRALMEEAIPEVHEGIITIRAITREAGLRTKVFVECTNPSLTIDPVGTCIGPDSSRIHEVTTNLHNEKVDILLYRKNKALQILEAIKPATLIGLACPENFFDPSVDFASVENDRSYTYPEVTAIVANGTQGVAIGTRGVNVRLASRITHCTISVLQADEAINKGIKYYQIPEIEKLTGVSLEAKTEKPLSEEDKAIVQEATEEADQMIASSMPKPEKEAETKEETPLAENNSEEAKPVMEEKKEEETKPLAETEPVQEEKKEPVKEEEKPAEEKKEETPTEPAPAQEEKKEEEVEHIEIVNKPKFDIADLEAAASTNKKPKSQRPRRYKKKTDDKKEEEKKPSLAARQEAMPIYTPEEQKAMEEEEQESEDNGDFDNLDIDEEYDDDKYYNN